MDDRKKFQGSVCPGRQSKRTASEYKSEMLIATVNFLGLDPMKRGKFLARQAIIRGNWLL